MLLKGTKLLDVASEQGFATPVSNISSHSMFSVIIQVCEEKQPPHITAIHPDELKYIGDSFIPPVIQAAYRSSVPTMIHLDHGASYEQVIHAIQCGLTSVMIDGSLLSYEESVALAKKVVEVAYPVGTQVEAELGTIDKTDGFAENGTNDIVYIDPQIAKDLLQVTGADSPVVAIDIRHDLYPLDLQPELRIDLLYEIKKTVNVPLVFHGGSNNPDSEITKAIVKGINKTNISSNIKSVYFTKTREVSKDRGLREPNVIEPPCEVALKECVSQRIDPFNLIGEANPY